MTKKNKFVNTDKVKLGEFQNIQQLAYTPTLLFSAFWDKTKFTEEEVMEEFKAEVDACLLGVRIALQTYFKEKRIQVFLEPTTKKNEK